MAGDGKRRLPLVKEPEPAREEDVDRPPWHWSAIGAVAVMLAWLLLGMLTQAALQHWTAGPDDFLSAGTGARAVQLVAHATALALAAFAGGVFVGRFGVRAGKPQAAAAGAAAVVAPWLLVARGSPVSAWPMLALLLALLALFAAAFAFLGGRVGVRLR